MGPTLVLQSLSTLVLERLLVCLLTHLKGSHLVMPGVPSVKSVNPLVVPASGLGTQTPSTILPSVSISNYKVLRSGVQPSSVLPPRVGSQPVELSMPHIL